jgi:hypothetical protein
MLNLIVAGALLGTALGSRFSVLVLIPITVLDLTIIALNGTALGQSLSQLEVSMSLTASSIQFGYLAGTALQPAETVPARVVGN